MAAKIARRRFLKNLTFCEFMLDFDWIFGIMIFAVEHNDTQQYRSGHNEHDWKSCVRQKRTESSNLSCCARKSHHPTGWWLFFLNQRFEQGVSEAKKRPGGAFVTRCACRSAAALRANLSCCARKSHHPTGWWLFFLNQRFEQGVSEAKKRPGGAFFYWIEHSSAQVSSASASISSPAAARSGSSCCIRRRPS